MKTKKVIISISTLVVILALITFSLSKGNSKEEYQKKSGYEVKDTSSDYLDGKYEGKSRASYTSEPYWGNVKITIAKGAFTDVDFVIRDTILHKNVDSMYGVTVFADNPTYKAQCDTEEHGIILYPQWLIQKQDLDEVDAISGATFAYMIFKYSVKNALKNAKKPTGIGDLETDNTLVKIAPNPFASEVSIQYRLTEKSNINLGIYDAQGKLVKQLVNQLQLAGNYTVQWNDCSIEGIYYCRLHVNNKITCNKIIKVSK